jgi:hypothetical protein
MSRLGQICLVWDRICLVTKNSMQRKSGSGAKIMSLGTDKLNVSKLHNMELRKITRIIRSKLNSSIQI